MLRSPQQVALDWLLSFSLHALEHMVRNLCVHNLSGVQIPFHALRVLGLGFAYVPTPKPTGHDALKRALFSLHRAMRIQHKLDPQGLVLFKPSPIHVRSSWDPECDSEALNTFFENSSHDIEKAYFEFSDSPMFSGKTFFRNIPRHAWLDFLKVVKDKALVICPTDKNLGPAIVSADQHRLWAESHLLDASTYLPVSLNHANALVQRFYRNLVKWCRDTFGEDFRQDQAAKFVLQVSPESNKFPKFKLLIKVHKVPVATRPLSCSSGFITFFPSKLLHLELLPIVKALFPFIAKDSVSVVRDLETLTFAQPPCLVSQDITSLYPSIPLDDCMRRLSALFASDFCRKLGYDSLRSSRLLKLLELVLFCNIVNYHGTLYLQIKGGPQGTPVFVVVANLWVHTCEYNLVSRFLSDGRLLLWRRFIDDILAFFVSSTVAYEFVELYNAIHPNIRISGSLGVSAVWLDLRIFVGPRFSTSNRLDVELFQKPLNKYLYLPWSTFHSFAAKSSFVKSELQRYICNSSSFTSYLEARNAFIARLRARSFPPRLLQRLANSVSYAQRSELLFPKALEVLNNPSNLSSMVPRFNFIVENNYLLNAINLSGILAKNWASLPGVAPRAFSGRAPRLVRTNPPNIANIISQAYASKFALD